MNDLVAKGDYEALEDNELTICDGERLQLVEAGTDNWSRVKSLATNQIGWVPARYLVPISNQSLTDVRPAMKLYNGNTTIAGASSTSHGKNKVNIDAQMGNF
jgi:SH3 domain